MLQPVGAAVRIAMGLEQVLANRLERGRQMLWEPVELLSALACYEYQACETEDWESTEAAAFCRALRKELISRLSGYSEAPWEITPETESAYTQRLVDAKAARSGR